MKRSAHIKPSRFLLPILQASFRDSIYCFTSESVTVTWLFLCASHNEVLFCPKRLPGHGKHTINLSSFSETTCVNSGWSVWFLRCWSQHKLMLQLRQKITCQFVERCVITVPGGQVYDFHLVNDKTCDRLTQTYTKGGNQTKDQSLFWCIPVYSPLVTAQNTLATSYCIQMRFVHHSVFNTL